MSYLRVVGIRHLRVDNEEEEDSELGSTLTEEDIDKIVTMSKDPKIYETICK